VRIDTTDFNLEIISPYFDNTDDAKAVVTLIEALNPRATRIFLPKSDVGVVLCRKEYYEAVAGIPRVSWGLLPRNFTRYPRPERTQLTALCTPRSTGCSRRGGTGIPTRGFRQSDASRPLSRELRKS